MWYYHVFMADTCVMCSKTFNVLAKYFIRKAAYHMTKMKEEETHDSKSME